MKTDNNYYVLTENGCDISLDKFHICTWDVKEQRAFIEVGVSIPIQENTPENINIYIALPFVTQKCEIISLHKSLGDDSNFRFVFNRTHKNKVVIDNDLRNGSIFIIDEEENNDVRFAIVDARATIINEQNIVKFELRKPQNIHRLYARVLIKTNTETLANTVSGITKKDYLYDIKINEARNIPDKIFNYNRDNNLHIIKIEQIFCLHAIPEKWNINYSDSSKLKNVRRLEIDAFKKYMKWVEKIDDEYLITFSKCSGNDGCSFFTSFSNEYVSNRQLLVAVITNLICSMLIGWASIKFSADKDSHWYSDIPITYYFAALFVLLAVLYCWNIPSLCWRKIKSLCSFK